MYQIKAQNGYEIQVIGRGENGLCRVVTKYCHVCFTGTYAACVAWLTARAIAVLG
jgi:hypothetical protein